MYDILRYCFQFKCTRSIFMFLILNGIERDGIKYCCHYCSIGIRIVCACAYWYFIRRKRANQCKRGKKNNSNHSYKSIRQTNFYRIHVVSGNFLSVSATNIIIQYYRCVGFQWFLVFITFHRKGQYQICNKRIVVLRILTVNRSIDNKIIAWGVNELNADLTEDISKEQYQ